MFYNKSHISSEIRDRLHQAINNARLRGTCVYVEGGNPCCVIGQFGFLSGLSLEELVNGSEQEKEARQKHKWCADFNSVGVGGRLLFADIGAPDELMVRLQYIWDVGGDEEDGRQKMREFLNDWPVEN